MGTVTSSGVIPYKMKVDSQGRGVVFAATETEQHHINSSNGKVWSIDLEGAVANAGTYVAYFQNTSQVNYHLTNMRAHCLDAASMLDIDVVTVGTVGNDTSFLPAQVSSRNVGATVTPTGNMAYATDATGLTGLTKVSNLFHAGDVEYKSSHLSTESHIIVPPGAALAINVVTANAANGIYFTWTLVEVTTEVA